MKILIVGAGLSGATLAERFANDGHDITVIEKRSYIAGNVYDYMDNGIRVGTYGAHIFHTSYKDVWEYVNRFSKWIPYQHKVVSFVDNKIVPIPININTVNKILGLNIKSEKEMIMWLRSQGIGKIKNPKNSEESALNRIGNRELYEKMIKCYTEKQWDREPKELEASVLDRIPVRTDWYDRYFSDKHEGLPENGYTEFVANMLDHEKIKVFLDYDYFKAKEKNILPDHDMIFFTGKIDTYFGDKFGKLEYRSLRFEHELIEDCESYQTNSVVNYPSKDFKFTRIIEHKKFYNIKSKDTLITKEYSISGGEAYYPVPNKKNRDLYEKYKEEANNTEENVYFVGRLANYKYFNMDQAIKNALDIYNEIKEKI